jgi:cellulose synthase/poly-beta-1,6-N-acetylglucosamine synthase-like glycosyltransferase
MMLVTTIILMIITLAYTGMMMRWAVAWYCYPGKSGDQSENHISVTVIIPVRNEENNLPGSLHALLQQDFPSSSLEILIIDDFSEDGTITVAGTFSEHFREKGIAFQVLPAGTEHEHSTGKKAALERGIAVARGELIFTTDADCLMNPGWVKSIVSFQQQTGASMVVSMVELDPSGSCFASMQALEFAGLTGSGGASLICGQPLMCNGANLMFKKSDFLKVGGYSAGREFATGDDTFLMFALNESSPGSVRFYKSADAVVTAKPSGTLREFVSQRIRWISKVKHYKNRTPSVTGLTVALANLAVLVAAAAVFVNAMQPLVLLIIFILKCSGDLVLLIQVLGLLDRRRLLLLFLPATLLLPVYFLISGWFLVIPSGYQWKSRSYPA